MSKLLQSGQMERRRVDISLARTMVYKRNVSLEELDFTIQLLSDEPSPSYTMLGLLVKLKDRRKKMVLMGSF